MHHHVAAAQIAHDTVLFLSSEAAYVRVPRDQCLIVAPYGLHHEQHGQAF